MFVGLVFEQLVGLFRGQFLANRLLMELQIACKSLS